MRNPSKLARATADWCAEALGEEALSPDEGALFLAAALVLLPPELELSAHLRRSAPAPEPLRAALRSLWLRTGRGPTAPSAMPEHPLAPGLLTLLWRRLRLTPGPALREEPQ